MSGCRRLIVPCGFVAVILAAILGAVAVAAGVGAINGGSRDGFAAGGFAMADRGEEELTGFHGRDSIKASAKGCQE